jgi:hypothetical protein
MSAQSQELIDRLIPEYRNELRENFVKTLQKICSGIRGKMFSSLCKEIEALIDTYKRAQETLQRYGNNYEALGQHIVRVDLGEYGSPGPTWWSQLNSRVFARVTGGHIWQETSTIEIRVLPSSGATNVSGNRLPGASLRNASYSLTGGVDPAPSADIDTADVPLAPIIAYPDVGAGVQVLGPGLEPGGGTQPPPMTCGATPSPGTAVQVIPTSIAAETSLGTWTASYPVKPYATLGYAFTTGNLYGLNPKASGSVSMTYAGYPPSLTISANLRCPGGCPLLNPDAGVVGYPEIIYGFSPWQSLSSSQAPSLQLPISVSNIQQSLWAVASYSLSGATLPALDVAYDIWITPPTSGCTVNLSDGGRADDYELMVWLDRTDDFPLPWSYLQGQPTLAFVPTWVSGSVQAVRWNLFRATLPGHQFPTLFAIPSEALSAGPVAVNIAGILREFGRNFSDVGDLNGDVIQSIELGSEFKGNSKSPAKAEYTLAIDTYCLASGSTPPSCPGSISTAMKPPQATGPANGGLSLSDQNIVSGVNTRLRRDATLKTQDIRVSVQNGVVTLEGTVATTAQKRRVESIAQTEKGVTLVKSRLAVSGPQTPNPPVPKPPPSATAPQRPGPGGASAATTFAGYEIEVNPGESKDGCASLTAAKVRALSVVPCYARPIYDPPPSLKLKCTKDRFWYTPPVNDPPYGLQPKVERVSLGASGDALLFRATASACGSGSKTLLALLQVRGGRLVNVLPEISLSEIGEYQLWNEPDISLAAPVVAVANFEWGEGEAHFSKHRFRIKSFTMQPSGHYALVDEYVTTQIYGANSTDAAVLSGEGATILAHLHQKTSSTALTSYQAITLGIAAASAGIRNVDFRNFEYRPACLDRRLIRVSDGEWRYAKGEEQEYFQVSGVTYGDLIGDGQDEAVVWGACGGVANFQVGDILIFSMTQSGPRLLAELSPLDWGKGEQDNGGDFQVSGVEVTKQQLAVSFLAGGSHAYPQWTATAAFRWNGSRFVRTGVTRKPYKCKSP